MKFWQLSSVLRDQKKLLNEALNGTVYGDWLEDISRLCAEQDREKLDSVMPDLLCRKVLSLHPRKLYLYPDNCLRSYQQYEEKWFKLVRKRVECEELSFVSVYEKFGGSILEDVLEKGSARVV